MTGSSFRLFILAGLAACLLLSGAYTIDAQATLNLDLSCQPAELCWGDKLAVLASVENTGETTVLDVYLVVAMPDGNVFCFPGGSFGAPFISGVIIPEGASFSDVEVFSCEIPSGLPAGGYLWQLAAMRSGTFEIVGYATATMRLGYDCWESYGNYNNVRSLLVRGSDIFIGTANAGVIHYGIETGQYEHYGVSDGLASSEVNHLCLDDEGNVWTALGDCISGGDYFEDWGGVSCLRAESWESYYAYEADMSRQFRQAAKISVVAYSRTEKSAFAVSERENLYALASGALERIDPPEGAYETKWISNHPDGSVYVKVGSVLRRYANGLWSKVADGGWYPFIVASDGTVWSCGLAEGHTRGLWKLMSDQNWQEVGQFSDVRVRNLVEAAGRIRVLTSTQLAAWDGQFWQTSELPVQGAGTSLAVSQDGVAFVGTPEGVVRYRAGIWSTISFDCPHFDGAGSYSLGAGPTDVGFCGKRSYFTDWPRVTSLDGCSWLRLPDVPYGLVLSSCPATLFADSADSVWVAQHYPPYGTIDVYRFRHGDWAELPYTPLLHDGYCPCFAEDALGRVWFYPMTIPPELAPIAIVDGSTVVQYEDIQKAVEANYDIITQSTPKTDIWLLDSTNGIVWIRRACKIGPVEDGIELCCFDGEVWVEYGETLPGGGAIQYGVWETQPPVDIDAQGNVWALTDMGLCRLNTSGVWHEPSGRIDDLGLPLLADDYGHVWVARSRDNSLGYWRSRYRGVARFDIATEQWQAFTEQDVPICDWIWRMRSAPNGDVWFCTWEGATRYSQGPK